MDALSPIPQDGMAFDYEALPVPDRTALRLAADRIRDRTGRIRSDLVAIGRELLGVKDRLDHGAFAAWCQVEAGIEPRSAQRYMQAARLVGSLPEPARDTVTHLPPSTLYKLAAPSAPAEVVKEVVEAATNGTALPAERIQQRLVEAIAAQRELKKAMRGGRTEEQARALLKRRRENARRHDQRLNDERAAERAKREADRAELQALIATFVTDHPDAAGRVMDILRHSGFQYELRDLWAAALREAGA